MTDQPCRFCGSTDTRRVDESYYRSDDDHGDLAQQSEGE